MDETGIVKAIIEFGAGIMPDGETKTLVGIGASAVGAVGIVIRVAVKAVNTQGKIGRRVWSLQKRHEAAVIETVINALNPIASSVYHAMSDYCERQYERGYRTVRVMHKSHPVDVSIGWLLERAHNQMAGKGIVDESVADISERSESIVAKAAKKIISAYNVHEIEAAINRREVSKDLDNIISKQAELLTGFVQNEVGKAIVTNEELRKAYEKHVHYDKVKERYEIAVLEIWDLNRKLESDIRDAEKYETIGHIKRRWWTRFFR